MTNRLFVGSLAFNVTNSQLEDLFNQAGKVKQVNLITDKFSGQSRGFAFVEMSTKDEALDAVKKFNNFELEGRKIVVNEAREREDRGMQNRGNFRTKRW